jgi:hypothetical protein
VLHGPWPRQRQLQEKVQLGSTSENLKTVGIFGRERP